MSRTESRLSECAEELQARHGVRTRTCAADLCAADDATLARVCDAVADLEVGVLVNNAGRSYGHAEYLDALDVEDVRAIIQINTLSLTLVCVWFGVAAV